MKGSMAMKQRFFNRAVVLCMTGAMLFSLAACGDNKEKDEEITQETAQESEHETIEMAESEDSTENNDIDTVRDNSSDGITEMDLLILNLGFQPGDESESGSEPQFGQEANPSTEAQPGEAAKPSAEARPSAVPQPGEEPEYGEAPQSGATPQPSTAPQPGSTSQSGTTPQSGTGSQPTAPQPSAAPQPTHTHTWVTNTVHHDATGHYESIVIGQEQVQVGEKVIESGWRCNTCGEKWITTGTWGAAPEVGEHQRSTGHLFADGYSIKEPIYETRDITENVWVQDSAAWDETVTTCSGCGARQ